VAPAARLVDEPQHRSVPEGAHPGDRFWHDAHDPWQNRGPAWG
jgi:hypothetical protein